MLKNSEGLAIQPKPIELGFSESDFIVKTFVEKIKQQEALSDCHGN